uniref:CCHC-type domain-containing protein n=1 Tax=Astyanax mexicanus TaxID=7994 RepID=A0A3B1IWV2_ASTMX
EHLIPPRGWRNFESFSPINFDIKNIIVKFWTGRISDADIELYLSRFCEILKPVIKPVDNLGFWYGIRKYQIKLKKDAQGRLLSIPNSVSLGPYNGQIIYQGQAPACFICQSHDHQAKECNTTKCWKCGALGHKSAVCQNTAMCSLCGTSGHSFFNCPHSYTNKVKQSQRKQQSTTVPRVLNMIKLCVSLDPNLQTSFGYLK